jgi:DNA-binding SARP family transcriptional activator
MMQFQVLGPLEAVGDNGPVPISGRRRRALLAILLMDPGRIVTLPELVDGIWADDPPDSAIANIRTYVHRLRRLLQMAGDSPTRLVSHPAGYEINVAPEELDLLRFHRLAEDGHQAVKSGDHRRAVDRLGIALSLWRGRPLADLPALGSAVAARVIALDDERWAATTCWVDSHLALGHCDLLIPQLRQMIAERPLCEQTRLQLILALRAAGRTADALSAYRDARRTSIEELGVEPGVELQRVHTAILNGQSPAPHRPPARPGRAAAPTRQWLGNGGRWSGVGRRWGPSTAQPL